MTRLEDFFGMVSGAAWRRLAWVCLCVIAAPVSGEEPGTPAPRPPRPLARDAAPRAVGPKPPRPVPTRSVVQLQLCVVDEQTLPLTHWASEVQRALQPRAPSQV